MVKSWNGWSKATRKRQSWGSYAPSCRKKLLTSHRDIDEYSKRRCWVGAGEKTVELTLRAMQQEYQARHANVEDTIRQEVYRI